MKRKVNWTLWAWVTGAFVALMCAWGTLIYISTQHPTESVPLEEGTNNDTTQEERH